MGSGHIDDRLCDALVRLFHVANGQEPVSALDDAVTSLANNCPSSGSALERLRIAALEIHVDADRRRRHESALHALLRVAQQLLESSSLEESLDRLVSATRVLLSADVAHINLHSGDGDYDTARAIQGEMTEAFRRQKTPPGAGVTGLVTETKSPYITTDYLSDPRIRHSATGDASVRSEGIRTLVGVPVLHRDDVIAVLIVSYRATTSISDEQLGLLVSLATLAALTMEDARRRDRQDALSRKLQDDSARLKAENTQLAWVAASYEELMDVVLRNSEIDELVGAISNAFHCQAGLLDQQGVLALPGQGSTEPVSDIPEEAVGLLDRSPEPGPRVLKVDQGEEPLWLCLLDSKDESAGAIILYREILDEIEQLTLARIGRLVRNILRGREHGKLPGELSSATVARLLDGPAQDGYVPDLSHTLSFSGTKTLVTLVAIADPVDRMRMHGIGVRIARDKLGAAGSHDGRLVLILPGNDVNTMAALVESRLTTSLGSPVWVGAASSEGPNGLSLAAAEALRCARCLRRMGRGGGSATVETLGQIGLLLGSEPEETVGEFIRMSIGPLLEYDKARRTELVRTLEAYLSHNGSLKVAASELHVHPNTVLQRLQKISMLLGDDDWRSRSEKRLDLQLALRLHSLSPAPS
jgi:hypothetical protein